jgi:hypothetical protein
VLGVVFAVVEVKVGFIVAGRNHPSASLDMLCNANYMT